jgi:hypothetical protein
VVDFSASYRARGCAGQALQSLAETISESVYFQELVGVSDEIEAARQVIPGPPDEPQDGDAFGRLELESGVGTANVYGLLEDGYSAATGLAIGHTQSAGEISLHVRRYLVESEVEQLGTAYIWFYDVISLMAQELSSNLESSGRLAINEVVLSQGPFFSDRKDEHELARYLWCELSVAWSDQPLES